MNPLAWCRNALLAVGSVLLLGGCPVPIPSLGYSSTSRDNLPEQVPAFLVKGKTTREEVLLALGSPDSYSPDGSSFAYRSERHTGGVVFVVAGGGHAGGAGVVGYEERLLIVRFDERSVLIDVTFENAICPRGVVAFDTGGGAVAPACLKVPDLSGGPSPEVLALMSLFVVQAETDDRGIHRLLVAELRRHGLDVSSGSASEAPPDVEAIVTYHDGWTGDATPRMDRLGLLIVKPRSSQVLAKVSSRQTPPAWKTPEQMVAEVVTNTFIGRRQPFLTMPPYSAPRQPDRVAPSAGRTVRIEPVRDARAAPRGRFIGERTALGFRLGQIDMTPAPVEMVGQVLREELAMLGHATVPHGGELIIDAQLVKFEVRTPSTLVYWDVNGSIAVDVGVTGNAGRRQVLHYDASCTDRTYVSLSEVLIRAVVSDCLDRLGRQVREDRALTRLLAGT